MDQIDYGPSIIAKEEDRISNMPDELIRHTLSFLDMKYAVQTSKLSRKWKHVWTSMPHLNLSSHTFRTNQRFANFVQHALFNRNHQREVSTVYLRFNGATTQFAVMDIVSYAYQRDIRQLTMEWGNEKVHELPRFLFNCHSLKYISLSDQVLLSKKSHILNLAWTLPALETLYLRDIRLGDVGDKSLNLFHKCVKLKILTLDSCSMFGLEIFNVYAPQLLNLTIKNLTVFPIMFNVFAPHHSISQQ